MCNVFLSCCNRVPQPYERFVCVHGLIELANLLIHSEGLKDDNLQLKEVHDATQQVESRRLDFNCICFFIKLF